MDELFGACFRNRTGPTWRVASCHQPDVATAERTTRRTGFTLQAFLPAGITCFVAADKPHRIDILWRALPIVLCLQRLEYWKEFGVLIDIQGSVRDEGGHMPARRLVD